MKIKSLNRGEAQTAMNEWLSNYPKLPSVDSDYEALRKTIQDMNQLVRDEAGKYEYGKKDYYIDVHLGILLYDFFKSQQWFTMRTAADDGFWRYLSVLVVPDVVEQRWGRDNEAHYWSRNTRIWLRSIWWYIHLSWQGSNDATLSVLETPHFSTDTILNFEERSGRNGTYVEAYRSIIYFYSKVSADDIKNYSRGHKNGSDDVFRVVMKLNTAKMMVMDPALCEGGIEAYARSLYSDVGVKLNDA